MPLDLKEPMLQLRTPIHPLTAFLSGWSATFALCVVLQPTLADEPTKSDAPTKPATTESKPGEGGVSISLKLLPSKKDEPAKESEKPESTADEKAKESTQSKPKADEKEPAKKPDKSQPTGTVELKLIPQKSPEPEKKPEPEKPSVEKKPDPTKPTGTVEMSLLPPKEKAPSKDSGKVTIELSMPKAPATRSMSDSPDSNVNGSDLKKPPKPTSSSESTEADNKSKPESTKSESNKAEAGDSKKGSRSRGGDPGDPGDGEAGPLPEQPGDIPLTQDAHPFDAPAAKATEEESRFSKSSGKKDSLSPADRERTERITEVLEYFKTHHENVVRRGPWALMHTILPYGVETEIIAGKQKVNAIGWLCHNGISAKQRIFQPTQTGFRTNVGPGVQGHEGQFLAILAQSHVHRDYPIQIGNKKYTINDLIKYEMATCREKTELTFKLIGFAHYLEPNKTWKDNRGRSWSIEKLVAEELAQPINGEACGGTHRLMGLTCAVVSRQEAGLKLTGHFERAEKFLNDYVEYTLKMQNPDGSFSTEWFERRADEPNIERKVQTTGHITEWLVYTLPDEHLRTPEIEKAIDFLLGTIGENPSRDWPIGPRGHALRALDLFQKRVYKGQDVSTETNLAKPAAKSLQR